MIVYLLLLYIGIKAQFSTLYFFICLLCLAFNVYFVIDKAKKNHTRRELTKKILEEIKKRENGSDI